MTAGTVHVTNLAPPGVTTLRHGAGPELPVGAVRAAAAAAGGAVRAAVAPGQVEADQALVIYLRLGDKELFLFILPRRVKTEAAAGQVNRALARVVKRYIYEIGSYVVCILKSE
jgi:hypothetical protein